MSEVTWIFQPACWEPRQRYYVEYISPQGGVVRCTAWRKSKGTPKCQITYCQLDGSSVREGESVLTWELRQDGTAADQYQIYPQGKKPSYRKGREIPCHMVREMLTEIWQCMADGSKQARMEATR